MRLADFQNPIANMPLVQQLQLAQNNQAQQAPAVQWQALNEEIENERTTVKESDEQEEKDEIKDDDEDRGAKRRRHPKRRAKTSPQEEQLARPRIQDGVHGGLDVKA